MARPERLMKQRIQIRRRLGINPDGSDKLEPFSTSSRCRIEMTRHRYVDANGDDAFSDGQVFLPGDVTLTKGDWLKLPDGTTRPALHVHPYETLRGKVIMQRVLL